MFREMRRKKQILTPEKSIEILKKGTSGVLALSGDDGYPYAVPLSYVYENSMLYFHGAKEGHKIDAIRTCDKASFCSRAGPYRSAKIHNVLPERHCFWQNPHSGG